MSDLKNDIIEQTLEIIRSGGAVSFDSVAARVGLTKPGLMHHFRTKEELMIALVDSVAEGMKAGMERLLGRELLETSPSDRISAYVEACLELDHDPADLAMFGDSRLRDRLIKRWGMHVDNWFEGIADLGADERGMLAAARMIGDGLWFASATGVGMPDREEREVIRVTVKKLIGSES